MRAVLSAELEELRTQLREWIARNRVPLLAEAHLPEHRAALYNLNYGAWSGPSAAHAQAWQEWLTRNADAGYLCPQWPVEVGGRGWDALQLVVWNEELAAAGMPRANRGLGEHLVGPAVVVHGTPEQKAYFLPRIISGEDVYAQGFSEPEAGSDLASLRATGRVVGDCLEVTGEKIWTSQGHLANRMFVLCRTDPDVAPHRGITYVIMDLHDNGITVRRTRQMTGDHDFTEEVLDGARAPLSHVIGGLGNGWRVAMTVLGFERGQMATTHHLGIQRRFWEAVDEARALGRLDDPVVRRELAAVHARIEALRMAGLRILAGTAFDSDLSRISSVGKVYYSELEQRLAETAFALRGADGLRRPAGEGYPLDPWQHDLLHSRCFSIQGRTNEVQRNILGERVLGLPKEPRVPVQSGSA
ncbi:MAG TPA: acyl-CoA dehydrogenase family protein [Mycobacteriales bacterium]|nr:acyl-CoA dehydrogenase family protein [Mycobacteriales bacterium]